MEIRTNIDSAGGGNTDAASTVDQDQSNLLSSRVVVSVWLAVGIGVLVIWLGLPDLGRIWPGDPMTYFGLAIQGTTRISLILLVVLAKSVVDYQRRGSKHFCSGTIISLGLWAVLGGL